MIVVADSGPLIHLSAMGRLELIHRLWDEVLVPQAVFDEVVVVGAARVGEPDARGRRAAIRPVPNGSAGERAR